MRAQLPSSPPRDRPTARRNYEAILRVVDREPDRGDLAEVIKKLRNAALADEDGGCLQAALMELEGQGSGLGT